MSQAKYQNIQGGIEHLSSHVEDAEVRGVVTKALHNINTDTGDPSACAAWLGGLALARAMLAWFKDQSLEQFKRGMYESAQLNRIAVLTPATWGFNEGHCLAPLLSDHRQLIEWYSRAEEVRPTLDSDNPRAHGFRWMQMVHAMRGDWAELEERAHKVLEISSPSQKKYMVDHRFYLALGRADVPGMEAALAELTSDKMARVRNHEFGMGYTHFFISMYAVIYAKLAWIHGFEVRVDSPYVPAEWLPVKPLAHYSDPYDFMARFPI